MQWVWDKAKNQAEKFSFFSFCIIMANAVLFGTGNFTHELNFSIFSVCILLTICFFAFSIVKCAKEILRNLYFWLLIGLGISVLVSCFVGMKNNNKAEFISADVKCLIYFVLFPITVTLLSKKDRILTLMKVIVYASFAQGIMGLFFIICFLFFPDLFEKLLYIAYYGEILNFTRISATIPRILFVSTPFQLCGCAMSLYFIATEKKNLWQYPLIIGTSLFFMLMTFTRALYLAAFIVAVLSILMFFVLSKKECRKRFMTCVISAVLICLLLVGIFSISTKTNYIEFALQRIGVTIVGSDPDDEIVKNTDSDGGYSSANAKTDSVQESVSSEVVGNVPNSGKNTLTDTGSNIISDASTDNFSTSDTTDPVQESVSSEVASNVTNSDKNTSSNTDSQTIFDTSIGDSSASETIHDENLNYLDETVISDNRRGEITRELLLQIKKAPILGGGLGFRLEGRDYSYPEYFFLDLWAKMGIVGLVLFLLPVFVGVCSVIKKIVKREDFILQGVWLVSILGLLVYAIFQPYMNNAPCILFYCCVLSVLSLKDIPKIKQMDSRN